jgi:hypothetical protein
MRVRAETQRVGVERRLCMRAYFGAGENIHRGSAVNPSVKIAKA